jgi:hypothetical protein
MKTSLENLNKFHNDYIDLVDQINSDEIKASLYQSLCTINWKYHTGRFFCDKVESELIKIGLRLKIKFASSVLLQKDVLHVASELYNIGGHTRLLESYVDIFDTYNNHLFITRQEINELPQRIKGNIKINNIIHAKNEESLIQKARELALLWRKYKYIILHIHPDDVVPIIAYGIFGHKNILFVNHADHVFWIGKRILKECINIRPLGFQISKELREISSNYIVPVILSQENLESIKEKNQKVEEKIIFGSMTSLYKIIPSGKKNFLKDIYTLLDKYPLSEFHLIGIEESDLNNFGFNSNLNSRLILHGHVERPRKILDKIDIYLEGYPYNSLTALYEAIISGACPVLMYELENPNCNLESDFCFERILFHSKNKQQYYEHIQNLVDSKILRYQITSKIQNRLKFFNSIQYARDKIFSDLVKVKPNSNESNVDLSLLSIQTFLFDQNQFKSITNHSILYFLDIKMFKKLNKMKRLQFLRLFRIFKCNRLNLALYFKLLK